MSHGISANGGGLLVNEYTIQIDFKVAGIGSWYTFLQTNPLNSDDGEGFINTNGNIGLQATGYSSYAVSAGEWYRLVISVNNGTHYRYYLDGQLLLDGTAQVIDDRFSLENIVLLFGDNDGDDGEIDVAEVAIWDKPLTTYQVQNLGGYGHILPVDILQPVCTWKFDNSDNLAEGFLGKDLTLVGTHQQVDGPSQNNKAVRIGSGSYYQAEHGISANGGGSLVNEYTLQFDFKVPDITSWKAFFQTTQNNSDDADFFINTEGKLGTNATGYGAYSVSPNEWYRLIIAVKNGEFFRTYLDGQPLLDGTKQNIDGRFSLPAMLLLFADNDGEDGQIDIAQAAIWNRVLAESEITALGGFGHVLGDTTANTPKLVGDWKFDDPSDVLKAEPTLGLSLELIGTHEIVDGPTSGNDAVKIGIGSYYKMTHGISANGGGLYVNSYTLQFDFKIPDLGPWYSFFQTSGGNGDDGDCFINPTGNIGVGATGYSNSQIEKNEWYRLVISVENGKQYKYFIDGKLIHNGTAQSVDGRFALADKLLIFADNDGEDSDIYCSELKIWNYSLTEDEVKNLGGFGHQTGIKQLVLLPYLQSTTPTSTFICWHDTASALTKVEFGTTESLGQSVTGTNEIISDPFRWHSVKLTSLQPNTTYYYKAISGSGESKTYSFKTYPDSTYKGKIRILQFSDTHSSDTSMAMKVIRAAKQKVEELYGTDIQNQVNLILHSGDLVVSGSAISQFTDQYFAPFAPLSPYVPIMTTTGNHEGETQFYYDYFHYDEFSAFPYPSAQNEKFYSFTVGNTAIISLNTNIVKSAGVLQKVWVEMKLKEYESNPNIDFVFFIFHHPFLTELWVEALTFDGGPNWVRNELFPILKKYSKVQQVTYGHTHAFERGVIESDKDNGDFRTVCAGGGGGATDNWGEFINKDYPQIHTSFDHYHFLLMEIDVENKTFEESMYSLGNDSKTLNAELLDRWHRRINQSAPEKPVTYTPVKNESNIVFNASAFAGSDSLMSSRFQVSEDPNFKSIVIDSISNWQDIYGVDGNFNPVDKNAGIDLSKLTLSKSKFTDGKTYYYRVKYRDHNLRWSPYSDNVAFDIATGVELTGLPDKYKLEQNFPNPFNPSTTIRYQIPEAGFVSLKIYDVLGKELFTITSEEKLAGRYEIHFDGSSLSSGIYYYRLKAGNFLSVKKLVLVK